MSGTVIEDPPYGVTMIGVFQGIFGRGVPAVALHLPQSGTGNAHPNMVGFPLVLIPLAVLPSSCGSLSPPNQVAICPRTRRSGPSTMTWKNQPGEVMIWIKAQPPCSQQPTDPRIQTAVPAGRRSDRPCAHTKSNSARERRPRGDVACSCSPDS